MLQSSKKRRTGEVVGVSEAIVFNAENPNKFVRYTHKETKKDDEDVEMEEIKMGQEHMQEMNLLTKKFQEDDDIPLR